MSELNKIKETKKTKLLQDMTSILEEVCGDVFVIIYVNIVILLMMILFVIIFAKMELVLWMYWLDKLKLKSKR